MNEILIRVSADEEATLRAPTRLKNGTIEAEVAEFAEEFCFNDRALGLAFTNRDRLREFFEKERELYPDLTFRTKKILVVEDHVIAEWLLEYTIKQPFYANTTRDFLVSLPGVSLIRTKKSKIIEWSDYYDGLTARRTALTSYFTDWGEY